MRSVQADSCSSSPRSLLSSFLSFFLFDFGFSFSFSRRRVNSLQACREGAESNASTSEPGGATLGGSAELPEITFIFKRRWLEPGFVSAAALPPHWACHRKASRPPNSPCQSRLRCVRCPGLAPTTGHPGRQRRGMCVTAGSSVGQKAGRESRRKPLDVHHPSAADPSPVRIFSSPTQTSERHTGVPHPPWGLLLCHPLTWHLLWHLDTHSSPVRFGCFYFLFRK